MSLGLVIQGPREALELGSTGGKHRTEGVLVRGTEPREYRSGMPSLGSISGNSESLGKHRNQGSTQNARKESSEGVYISTSCQLSIGKLELLRSQAVYYSSTLKSYLLSPLCTTARSLDSGIL